MQKSAHITPAQLHQLGFSVIGDEAVPLGDSQPDPSWGLDRLAVYIKGEPIPFGSIFAWEGYCGFLLRAS